MKLKLTITCPDCDHIIVCRTTTQQLQNLFCPGFEIEVDE